MSTKKKRRKNQPEAATETKAVITNKSEVDAAVEEKPAKKKKKKRKRKKTAEPVLDKSEAKMKAIEDQHMKKIFGASDNTVQEAVSKSRWFDC